jgi:hypothetical protein
MQSSKRLIESKIHGLGVGDQFKVLHDRIITPGDGLIIFQGMQETGEQLRQLGDVRRDPAGLVPGHQLGCRPPSRLVLEIHIGERVAVVIPDDEAGVGLLDGPGRRAVRRSPSRQTAFGGPSRFSRLRARRRRGVR